MSQYFIRFCAFICCFGLMISQADAQEMQPDARASAVNELRGLAACVHEQDAALDHILELLAQAEEQEQSTNDRLRRAAQESIEALIGQANDIQRELRSCIQTQLPGSNQEVIRVNEGSPQGPRVEQRNSIRVVDHDRTLIGDVQVINAEQVDGRGNLPADVVRQAIDRIASSVGAACAPPPPSTSPAPPPPPLVPSTSRPSCLATPIVHIAIRVGTPSRAGSTLSASPHTCSTAAAGSSSGVCQRERE